MNFDVCFLLYISSLTRNSQDLGFFPGFVLKAYRPRVFTLEANHRFLTLSIEFEVRLRAWIYGLVYYRKL